MSDPSEPSPKRSRFRRFLERAEIDQAVIFVLLTRIWGLPSGIVTMFMVTRYLTEVIQGFYFTFASILALQSFFELGFFIVLINVASHEWSKLDIGPDGRIKGDSQAHSRLVSLGRLAFSWYAAASFLFIVLISVGGYIFFQQKYYPGVSWEGPWFLLVVITGLILWTLPFMSILEGCNQVVEINRFRFIQSVLGTVALWITLYFGGDLWVPVASSGTILACNLFFLFVVYGRFFESFRKPSEGERISWRDEVWPMQWRIGLSGVVNYFAYNLFNPVMFQYQGAEEAGRMGLTREAIKAVQQSGMAWVTPKVPRYGMMISRKDYTGLDRLWYKSSLVSVVVVASGGLGLLGLLHLFHVLDLEIADRFLPMSTLGLFVIAAIFMQISQCQSAYLRAHRKEPILVMSVTVSILIGLLVWQMGMRYGAFAVAGAYLGCMILTVVWETAIWSRCRKAWHKD